MLWDEYDWPFARIHKEDAGKTLMEGERYYDFPDLLDVERTVILWRKNGNVWGELIQGITPEDYSAHDSDLPDKADPALKWDVYDESQFEVWPVPASDNWEVRFDGYRRKTELVDDEARMDLDDILVVLYAAAEILTAAKQADGPAKLQAAERRLNRLRGRLATKTRIGFFTPSIDVGRRGPIRLRIPRVAN